jgi:phage baseplate assembly protein W
MGYEIIPAVTPVSSNVLSIDASFQNNGVFKPLYTTTKQASAHFKTLLQTQKGERFYHPTYGTDLIAILFEPNVTELKQEIAEIINNAANTWLSYIRIVDINITTNEDDPTLDHQVIVSITITADAVYTETIVIFVGENGNISIT